MSDHRKAKALTTAVYNKHTTNPFYRAKMKRVGRTLRQLGKLEARRGDE